MKRKYINYILAFLIVILASCFLITKKIREKNRAEYIIAKIPDFSFLTFKQRSFSKSDIDNSKSRIIINQFSPACEHCQYMAVEFLEDSQKLKDVQILMITTADYESAAKFSNDYKLSLLHNVVILRDTSNQFQKTFGTSFVPSFYIYENSKLVKKIIGETQIENLIY